MSRNRLRALQVSGLVVLFFAGMALAGSVALGKGKPSQETTSTGTQTSTSTSTAVTTTATTGKVLVCHRTHSKKKPFHTISVSVHALQAHLNHGDSEGACAAAPTTSSSTQSPKAHGKSADAKGHNK